MQLLGKQASMAQKRELIKIYSFQKGEWCRYYATFLNMEICKVTRDNQGRSPIEVLNENLDLIILNGIKRVTNIVDRAKGHDPVIIDLPEGSQISRDKYDELILGTGRVAVLKLDENIDSECVKEERFKRIIGQEVLKTLILNLHNFKTEGRQQNEIESDLDRIFLGTISILSNDKVEDANKKTIFVGLVGILADRRIPLEYLNKRENFAFKNTIKQSYQTMKELYQEMI